MRRPFCRQSSIAEKALISVCAVGFIIVSYLTLFAVFPTRIRLLKLEVPNQNALLVAVSTDVLVNVTPLPRLQPKDF